MIEKRKEGFTREMKVDASEGKSGRVKWIVGGRERGEKGRGEWKAVLLVTLGLIRRCKRMHVASLWPSHWEHFYRGIEFHRATTKHDSTVIQGQIFVFQMFHVT